MTGRSDASPPLRVERLGDEVLALWLDRPLKRNALNLALVTALTEALAEATCRAVVLGTSDAQCFSAGADLGLPDSERAEVSRRLYHLYGVMLAHPAPIVVAVQGAAVGGGAQLALAGDLRVGDPRAFFRFAGPGHGLAVGAWGLPSLVGRGRAIDLCLTMRNVEADEALAIGLLDRVDDDARASALDLARRIAGLDPAAVDRVKRIVRTAARLDVGLELEDSGNAAWSGTVPAAAPGGRRS